MSCKNTYLYYPIDITSCADSTIQMGSNVKKEDVNTRRLSEKCACY